MQRIRRRALRHRLRNYGAAACAPMLIVISCSALSGQTRLGTPQAGAAQSETSPGLAECWQAFLKTSPQPPDLLQALTARPRAEAYNALGALFAQRKELACAIASFEAGLRLDPASWETRYNLALALESQRDFQKASQQLRTVIHQKPDSFAAHNALGFVLRSLGQPVAAADEFKKALEINPKFADALLNLAELNLDQKRYSAAIYYLRQGLATSPPEELAQQLQMDLAVAYSQIEKYDDAAGLFRKLIALHPNSAQLHFNLATVYAHVAQYAEASDEYKKALQLDPTDDSARLSLAKALLMLNQLEETLPHVLKYTQNKPEDPEGYDLLGQAYRKLGRFEEAVKVLRRAIELDPRSYDARYNLGFSLARLGDTDQAIDELKAATQLKPDASEALYELGLLLSKGKKRQAAKNEFRAFQQIKEQKDMEIKAGVLNNQANAFLEEGRVREAADTYRQVVELVPNNARFHYNLSLALSRLGERAGEQKELETAIGLDSNLAEARNQLGVNYMAEGKSAEAEREFKSAIEINPQYAEAKNNLGTLYGRKGKNSEAAALYLEATKDDPQYAQAYVNLGLLWAGEGKYDEAEQQFQNALRVDPNNVAAFTALGMVETKKGRGEQAVQAFNRVIALNPASPEAHLNLGIALGDRYDFQGAMREFSEVIRLAPNSAVGHYNKGRVLYDLGKRKEAQEELETACRLEPNYASALFLLAVTEGLSPHSAELLQRLVVLEPRNAEAQYLLGQNLIHLGKTREAVEHWKMALQADSNNYMALFNLARTLSKSNDTEAKQYMDRFQEIQKARQLSDHVQQLNNFALAAANAHNWPQAVQQLQESIQACGQCPQLPTLHRNLGLIYCRKGDLADGKRELETALKLNPNDADAQKALGILQSLPPTSSK